MKKFLRNNFKILITITIAVIILISGTAYATIKLSSNEVGYKETTVEEALNDLYSKTANNGFCKNITGNKNTIGSKYECDPGDGIYRVFYVLKVNSDTVELIMDRNINSGTMDYNTALTYLTTGAGKNIVSNWVNVESVDSPKAETIANAVGNTDWNVGNATANDWFYLDKYNGEFGQIQVANASNISTYNWLYNFTRECTSYGCSLNTSLDSTGAYGYWLKEKVYTDSSRAWSVSGDGNLGRDTVSHTNYGVRPVITLLKSNF